ncbi:HAD family hydrolase [Desulfotomaculum sp. 1211_IL3151]|uniref:HAD family hydrolase n=1 Tax=Desulfotomaculum sp. 1211_IL3151 TaxID=3084055 RepID=UPI002FDAC40B
MIFASDLDRTIIYSDKFLRDFSGEVVAVEYGKYNSYMTKPASQLLKIINREITFVPCTTRTIEQYQRIQFFQREVTPKYAVVSNGANLLVDGNLDLDYQKSIAQALVNNCLASEDILKEFDKLNCGNWTQPMRHADGVFHYCIIERDKAPWQELNFFKKWAEDQRWEMSIQGRKLYLVPCVINKGAALRIISERIGEAAIFSAGDSLLDIPLIKEAQYRISPAHGELFEQCSSEKEWKFTKASGILAGEEILQQVYHMVCGSDN